MHAWLHFQEVHSVTSKSNVLTFHDLMHETGSCFALFLNLVPVNARVFDLLAK